MARGEDSRDALLPFTGLIKAVCFLISGSVCGDKGSFQRLPKRMAVWHGWRKSWLLHRAVEGGRYHYGGKSLSGRDWQSLQSGCPWCGWQLWQTWTDTEAQAASAEPNSHGGERMKALLSACLPRVFLSIAVFECVCVHTTPRTGTDESARLQP